ncbi:MAG: hypothetical protein IIB22_07880 [Chloroflexi bacterium]|nr:hypothetical protein [Chloroflexota bacterium]
MAKVFGNIEPQDDYTHELGPEENFNESMYFNFFDQSNGYGGFMRCGNRANEGNAEVTLCLFLPTGEVLFNYAKPHIDNNDAMDAGGMRFEVIEPLEKHHTTYKGDAVFLTKPEQMADPGTAFRENPHKKIELDLIQEAVGPVYGFAAREQANESPEQQFAKAHYEQHMKATGTLTIDGETIQINGTGLRDHSWGPRYWQALHSYRWLTCTFGPDFGLMVSEVSAEKGVRRQNGCVVRDGDKFERIVSFDIESEYVPDTLFHKSMKADLRLEGGDTLVLEGTVKGFIPLRNRRAGMVTHIGEGMTEYPCEGRTAYGISEYLDQVE